MSRDTHSPQRPNVPRQALQTEALEARQLLASDLAEMLPVAEVALAETNDGSEILQSLASQTDASRTSDQLVIIDDAAPDLETLTADLESRGVDYAVLDSHRDGIEQISDLLAERSGLSALHILSHGENGRVQLGDSWLDAETLQSRASEISIWSQSFSDQADVLFYGCNLAGDASGEQFLQAFGRLTGADVAASTDPTGSEELGGDWDLEYQEGVIQSASALSREAQNNFSGLLAVTPSVSVDMPAEVFIGEDFQFTVTFDNTGAGTETGYGPFVDLVVPSNGADGAAGTDTGDGFTLNSATYLGVPVVTTTFVFPDDGGGTGSVTHPYAVDNTGTPLEVTGTAGDTLHVFQLPFGSITPDQPEMAIQIDATLSNLADLGVPLEVQTRGGFQFGEDELDNPATDPTLFVPGEETADSSAWSATAAVTPKLIELTKITLSPESETATGPNFVRQWQIDIDIADGQTITDLDIIDDLPNNVVFQSLDAVTFADPSGVHNSDNSATLSTTRPENGNQLIVNVDATGTTGTADVTVIFSYYVSEFDADGFDAGAPAPDSERVIPVSGEDDITPTPIRTNNPDLESVSPNDARAVGDWDPIDTRDAGGTDNVVADPDPVEPETILDNKSIAIQKGVTVLGGPGDGTAIPGNTLEYTLDFQISDYYTFGDIVITDTMGDGQNFDTTFAPTFTITDRNGAVAGTFNLGGNLTHTVNPDGTETLVFDVSQALVDNGAADGVLQGGLTTAPDLDDSAPLQEAVGTITLRSVIQEDYDVAPPSGDLSVDQGDRIDNDVIIDGTSRDNTTITTLLAPATSDIEDDDSGARVHFSR